MPPSICADHVISTDFALFPSCIDRVRGATSSDNPTTGNGHVSNGVRTKAGPSHLQHTEDNELHDLICIGFGPASLAIAVALHDALDESHAPTKSLPRLGARPPKIAFLERQRCFGWHTGMLLEGAKMQISFVKDLATLRNPRSEFTFLNYLHRNNRLVQFTNLSTFLPQRIEYEDYMRWCAGGFEEVVEYNQEVLEVSPIKSNYRSKVVDCFKVRSLNTRTRMFTNRRARHVVIAVGGKPHIPKNLHHPHPRVLHSSEYSIYVPSILTDPTKAYKIAVVGAGQSAAEIFHNLHSRYPNAKTSLIIKGAALRPSDDSPFVNEIFDPDRVDDVFHQSSEVRSAALKLDRGTNYGVVRLELLERIYEDLYTQRIKYRNEDEWPRRILNHRTVTSITDTPDSPNTVRLHIDNQSGQHRKHGTVGEESMDPDLVLVAAGYTRDTHEAILHGARGLMPGGDAEGKRWTVGRDYKVQFEEGKVSSDAGIWLQGCNESTHGLSDTLLSVLATRSGEIVQSMFGKANDDVDMLGSSS
ncbi:L-ornithine 5-monooxygenase (L-ornithine N(5)-oxygenase) [Cryomyces antarcticus]